MALPTFTPSGTALVLFGSSTPGSQTIALPGVGTDTTVLVSNGGSSPIAVLLGTTSGIAVSSFAAGVLIPANATLALARGSNSYIAVLGLGGTTQYIGVASGV